MVTLSGKSWAMLIPMRRFLPLLVLAFAILPSCSPRSPGETAPATDPDIRGILTKVNLTVEPWTVLVEEKPEEAAGSAKAMVRLTEATRILRRAGSGIERTAPQDLAVAQRVSVWFTGPVMESYPVQATAAIVVIEGP